VVAFHDELEVVETYVANAMRCNQNLPELHIGKIKKKKVKNMTEYDELYLVRYCDTYVQSGYLVYLEILSDQFIYDEKLCKDVLLRILECKDITDKERKSIERTVKVVDRVLQESKEFTPSLNELKKYESDYSPYMYNKGVY
jgi:hypothetical protein